MIIDAVPYIKINLSLLWHEEAFYILHGASMVREHAKQFFLSRLGQEV